MKRSYRIFSIILGLLLCISLLTGCNTNKDPNAPKHTRDNGRKLTIYCTEDDPYQKRLIDNYNAQADEKDQIEIQSYGAASDIFPTRVLEMLRHNLQQRFFPAEDQIYF